MNVQTVPTWLGAVIRLRAFVSHCTIFDNDLLEVVRHQSQAADSPLDVVAWSADATHSLTSWESRVAKHLKNVDIVLVLIGTMLDSQIRDEVGLAKTLAKPVVAVVEQAGDPRAARVLPDEIVYWTEADLFDCLRRRLRL